MATSSKSAAAQRRLRNRGRRNSPKKPTPPKKPASPKKPTSPKAGTQNSQTPQTPQTPQAPTNVYDPNATVSNASGLINLQTTHDLNMQEIEAQNERDAEIAAANQDENASIIQETMDTNALGERKINDRGSLNKNLAYRGMGRGSTAIQKTTEMGSQHLTEQNQIAARRKLAADEALSRRTLADTTLGERKKGITLARTSYTVGQSGTSPTEGSKPVDSGIKPTTIPTPAAAPVVRKHNTTTKPVVKKPAKVVPAARRHISKKKNTRRR